MARLSIREYSNMMEVPRGVAPVGQEPAETYQVMTVLGASTQSDAFGANTRLVRLHTEIDCSVSFGPSPVAVAGSCDMVSGQTEYFGVEPGDKVAVIAT